MALPARNLPGGGLDHTIFDGMAMRQLVHGGLRDGVDWVEVVVVCNCHIQISGSGTDGDDRFRLPCVQKREKGICRINDTENIGVDLFFKKSEKCIL